MENHARSWQAILALMIGFFMIMLDSTIVMVANPAIMRGLHLTSYSSVMWVTSAYLLAAAVPLLITGRLGDRYGPKNIYLIGLAIFTLSSAACGLSGTMGGGLSMLVAARVAQGLGAALMTPQTMAVITRTFAPDQRGPAMGMWGAVAGVASLVGPILGGLLTDALGWEWIFFINVPIGVVAFIAAFKFVPKLETHEHTFDWFGIALSAIGLFLLIFGVQEGEQYDWGVVFGGITVWEMIGAGVVILGLFVVLQSRKSEPLLPLRLFKERNFSVANGAISLVGASTTALSLPMLYYFQLVRGMSPTESALMLAPSAIVSFVGAPLVGRRLTVSNSKWITFTCQLMLALGLGMWALLAASPTASIGWMLVANAIIGVANSGMYSPLGTLATRDLAPIDAGAGAGVYNTTRQIGSVLGSAGITAVITWAVSANVGGAAGVVNETATVLPDAVHAGFSVAMAQATLLPIIAIILSAVVSLLLQRPTVKVPDLTADDEPVAAGAEPVAADGEPVTADAGAVE